MSDPVNVDRCSRRSVSGRALEGDTIQRLEKLVTGDYLPDGTVARLQGTIKQDQMIRGYEHREKTLFSSKIRRSVGASPCRRQKLKHSGALLLFGQFRPTGQQLSQGYKQSSERMLTHATTPSAPSSGSRNVLNSLLTEPTCGSHSVRPNLSLATSTQRFPPARVRLPSAFYTRCSDPHSGCPRLQFMPDSISVV